MTDYSIAPPAFLGAIRSLDDLRATLERAVWATETAMRVLPAEENKSYLRGKLSVQTEILARLDWPDNCGTCGKSPVCDTIDGMALCADCVDAWMDNQDTVDGETA